MKKGAMKAAILIKSMSLALSVITATGLFGFLFAACHLSPR